MGNQDPNNLIGGILLHTVRLLDSPPITAIPPHFKPHYTSQRIEDPPVACDPSSSFEQLVTSLGERKKQSFHHMMT